MSLVEKAGIVLALVMSISAGAWAQRMGRGMGQQPPQMPLSAFKPTIGSGAEYQMTAKGHTMNIAWVVVGKEDVGGATGYWMELRMEGADMPGEVVTKQLMVIEGGKAEIKRMITQAAGQPPMEMPMGMMAGMMRNRPQTGAKEAEVGEKLGTESVTVPAGTFLCDHYRSQQEKATVDLWVSTKVSPYGVVKMTGADMTMVLEKLLSNETSHIKGEPQKMKMPQFEMPHF
jgi:hypothetical protein